MKNVNIFSSVFDAVQILDPDQYWAKTWGSMQIQIQNTGVKYV